MKTKAKTGVLLALGIAIALAVVLLLLGRVEPRGAFADEATAGQAEEYVVSSDVVNVDAEFEFVILNETDCSVRLLNKSEATKAVIPTRATVDGKEYRVTEIAGSGFSSSPNLVRVSLPSSIKKINSSAFTNCSKLKRINLANVEEIGNSAFYKCTGITDIIIPKAVRKIGSNVFRGTDIQVKVRASSAGEEWSASWNKNNANQDVIYNSSDRHPIELEPIYDVTARSADSIVGYSVANGQPRNEDFYTVNEDNIGEITQRENRNIFIPAEYDGKAISGIADYAFSGAQFDQLVVEYSPNSIYIAEYAFADANDNGEDTCDKTVSGNIIINRDADFDPTGYTFYNAKVKAIVMPNNFESIEEHMFDGCCGLTNIYFNEPASMTRDDILGIVEKLKNDAIDDDKFAVIIPDNIKYIKDGAFQGTTAIKELRLTYKTIEGEPSLIVGASIVAGWDSNNQKVKVDNKSKIIGWHPQWNSNFENIIYTHTIHTVTFNPNGGHFEGGNSDIITATVAQGATLEELYTVEKEHAKFLGWHYGDVKFEATTIYDYYFDIELLAKWEPVKVDILLYLCDGTDEYIIIKANYGESLPKVKTPVRPGYDFLGCYASPDKQDNQYYYHDMTSQYELKTEEPIKIYAHWRLTEYNIELQSGYGDGIVFGNVKINHNEEMRHAEKPVREHYNFAGYFDEKGGKGTKYYDADMRSAHEWDKFDNGILYAHWTPIEYEIKYELGEGGHNNAKNPTKYTVESNFTFYEPTHDTMYFDYWQCNGNAITGTKGLSGNITVEAVWSKDTQKIKLDLTNGNKDMTVAAPKVIVTLTSNSYIRPSSGKLILRIASNVESVTVNGNGYYYSMSIIIEDRDEDFVLYLHNISIIALQDYEAIKMYGDNMLYLYNTGSVVIRGRSRSDGNGGTAISCGELMINSYMNSTHSLTVNGGAGSNGTNGISGTDGGNGGYAIEANKVIINCDNVLLYGGVPGNGGNGSPLYGFKGYGGSGAYPVKDMETKKIVFVTDSFSNVHFYKSVDGTDGTGIDRPQPPVIKPDPGYVIPPIIGGDDIPTPGPVVPPIINI